MKTIHCTHKLLKEITSPVHDLNDSIPDNSGPGNWCCNISRFNRRKCLIFTSELTLYTFFVYGVRKHDIESLPDLFRENLKLNLQNSGIEQHIIDQILNEYLMSEFSSQQPAIFDFVNNSFIFNEDELVMVLCAAEMGWHFISRLLNRRDQVSGGFVYEQYCRNVEICS